MGSRSFFSPLDHDYWMPLLLISIDKFLAVKDSIKIDVP